jgi:hypothetical protein
VLLPEEAEPARECGALGVAEFRGQLHVQGLGGGHAVGEQPTALGSAAEDLAPSVLRAAHP